LPYGPYSNGQQSSHSCNASQGLPGLIASGKLRFQKNVKVPGRGTERFYIITGQGLDAYRQRQAELAE
jgi:hypothetical protein